MAKVSWPKKRLKGLYQVIEEGSLREIEEYVDVECNGCLPDAQLERMVDGYRGFAPNQTILHLCCRAKKLDVLDALLARGLKVPRFSMEDLFSNDAGGKRSSGGIEYDSEQLAELKSLVLKMIEDGAAIASGEQDYVIRLLESYPEDIGFYERLHSAGLRFEVDSFMWGNHGYDFVFANGLWRTAEFFSALHVDIRCGLETGVIAKGWPPEAIDFVLEHNIGVGLFDEEASVETVIYAIRRGIELKPRYLGDGCSVWDAVVNSDNIELGDALINESISLLDVYHAKPSKSATLEWASRVGLNVASIDPTCKREVLLKAAELKIPPADYSGFDSKTFSNVRYSGCKYIGDQLDYDVIEAFLEAGISDGFDPSCAVEQGRGDIVELFERYGFACSVTTISDGAAYIDESMTVVVPDGITKIEDGAFKNTGYKDVHIAETVEYIGSNNFGVCAAIESGSIVYYKYDLVLPKNVKTVARNAFKSLESISFFDSLDGSCVGLMNGLRGECEFTVLSSSDDSVRFKVWRPDDKSFPYAWGMPFARAWRSDCSFDFTVVDQLYADLKTSKAKLRTAINRLTWPIDLDGKVAKKYRRYVSQNIDEAIALLCELNDTQRLRTVLSSIRLSVDQMEKYSALAKNKNAVAVEEALADMAPAQAGVAGDGTAPKAKKPTVSQTVTMVADALDEGDGSKVSVLEAIAGKIPMADCVELLERAAANCTGETIDALYGLFAPFECDSSSLLIALFSGNVSSARAIVAHGGDLAGDLYYVSEKRTPRSKRGTREKRYSHGLVGKKYSAGGDVAWDLREALTKYQGDVQSRTKTTYDWRRRKQKLTVNEPSAEKAADTLIAISKETGFKKSIAIRLLWNLISFDGRQTTDASFDARNARKVLEAGILTEEDTHDLPWENAVKSLMSDYCYANKAEALALVRDFATPGQFRKCWRPSFAKPSRYSGEYREIETLLLFVDVLEAEDCSNQTDVLKALVEAGELEALRKLEAKPGWFTKQRVKSLIDIASAKGHPEMTAWLLELSDSFDEGGVGRKRLTL